MLVHQLPASPSNLRVRTWRRLNQLGALPLKQAVYVLPDSPDAREDFEWLKAEIEQLGGEAEIMTAQYIDGVSEAELIERFRQARQDDFTALSNDIEEAVNKAARTRQPPGRRAPAVARLTEIFEQRLAGLDAIDFFGSAGRDRAAAMLDRFRGPRRTPQPAGGTADATFRDRMWVTRPRPGVDRMSSAWLIRRFIDPAATFGFIADAANAGQAIPYDMFGAEFSHHGDQCTFETLCKRFSIESGPIDRIARIVHDLDLKDGKYDAPEAATVGAMIDGLQRSHADDHELLEHGITLFESLFRSYEGSMRARRPRALAKAQSKTRK
jgi:hypothetical protein